MAIRIKPYERQVDVQTPNIPQGRAPSPVRAAFGESVYDANANLGATASRISGQLADHLKKQQDMKNEAKAAELETNFRLDVQRKLYDETPETIKVNGQDVTRPKGNLLRMGEQADGSYKDFNDYYKTTRENYVKSAPTAELAAKLGAEMDNYFVSKNDDVLKHQATQQNSVLLKAQISNFDQQVHDAASINNPQNLMLAVNKAMQTSDQINAIRGSDPETIEKTRKERAGDIVSKSVNATLMSTGDLESTQALLESAKDSIQPDRYETLNNGLVNGAEKIQKQQERAQTQVHIGNEATALSSLAGGEKDWMNIDEIATGVRNGVYSENFGRAYNNVIKSKGRYEYQKDENANYAEWIDKIYGAGDQVGLHGTLLDLLKDHKNLSEDKMSILINEAVKHGKHLTLDKKSGSLQLDPKQQARASAAQAISKYGKETNLSGKEISDIFRNYISSVDSGIPAPEALMKATGNHAITKNPSLSSIPGEGQIMIDRNGNKALVMPDGTFKEIGSNGSGKTPNGKPKEKK